MRIAAPDRDSAPPRISWRPRNKVPTKLRVQFERPIDRSHLPQDERLWPHRTMWGGAERGSWRREESLLCAWDGRWPNRQNATFRVDVP